MSLYGYGEDWLAKAPELFWVGDVDDNALARLIDEITAIRKDDPKALFNLWIKTGGGDFTVVAAFLDFMRVKKINLITTALGDVSSAGVFLFGAGKARRATRLTKFYFHKVCVNFDVDRDVNLPQMKLDAKNLEERHEESVIMLMDLYRLDRGAVETLLNSERRWTAKEMKRKGLVDQVI